MEGEVNEAHDLYEIPVIRPDYILDALSLGYLPSTRGYSMTPGAIFNQCIFSFTNISAKEDHLALWAMINFHGGQVSPELSARVTHLISGSASFNAKLTQADQRSITIVTPDFVMQSIKRGSLCNADLFHPRLMLLPGQKIRKVRKKKPVVPQLQSNQNLLTPTTQRNAVSQANNTPQQTVISGQIQLPQTPVTVTPQMIAGHQQSNPPSTSAATVSQPKTEEGKKDLPGPQQVQPQGQQSQQTPQQTPQQVQPENGQTHQQQPPATPGQTNQNVAENPQQNQPVQAQVQGQPQNNPNQQIQGAAQATASQPQEQKPPQANQQPSNQQPQIPPNQGVQNPQTQLTQQPPQSGQNAGVPPSPQQSGPRPPQWPGQQQQDEQACYQPQISQAQQRLPQQQQPQFRQQMMPMAPGQQTWQQQQPGQQQFHPQPQQMQMMARPRPTAHMLRQQHVIQQHIATLSPEQRNSFTQMTPEDKRVYLASRGLLLPNPQGPGGPVLRQTVTLTDQQREMLGTMDPQQRTVFLQKIQKEQRDLQMRQQMMQQQAQQQQMPPGQQQQQQMQWQQQHPQAQAPGQFNQISPQLVRAPHSSPGSVPPARMPMSQANQEQMRPTWSGETHPALAQVPRTPQQLQHLQRLQQQREQQQQLDPATGMMQPVPRPTMPGTPTQQGQMLGQPPVPLSPQQQQQQQQYMGQQQGMPPGGQMMANDTNQKTKAALQTMLSNRLQQPAPGNVVPSGMPMQQQAIPPTPPQPGQVVPPGAAPAGPAPHMQMAAPDGSAAGQLQLMNRQLHQPHHSMIRQQGPMIYSPRQQYMMQQQRMEMVNSGQHPGAMNSPRGYPGGPRIPMPQQRPPMRMMQAQQQQPQPQPQQPQGQRIQFHGHDPNTRRKFRILNAYKK